MTLGDGVERLPKVSTATSFWMMRAVAIPATCATWASSARHARVSATAKADASTCPPAARTSSGRFAAATGCMDLAGAVGIDPEVGLALGLLGVVADDLQLGLEADEGEGAPGGRRLLQRATGYDHTFVSGVEVASNSESTGATPGRLVRGAQAAPA